MLRVLGLSGLMLSSVALAACPAGTELLVENGKNYCLLKGKYLNSTLTLTADNVYRLDDEGVFIGGDNKDSSTLRIQAGTKIVGEPKSFLSVARGSKIFAEGTKTKPVVFTSVKETNRKRGEWGGIVLNGNAPINACKPGTALCEATSEGIKVEQVMFGGNNAEDSSGVLKYVRLEFTGYPISQDNELNGITMNAVGSGTEVDYVQVNMSADDGIECFGGTVQLKHIVLSNNDDDSLDWDFGYHGKIQYLLAKQADDSADNAIEADNFKSPMNAQPRSNPTISNATFVGGKNSAYGLHLRRGTSLQLHNSIVTGFKKACVDIDDAETFTHGSLSIQSSILSCAKNTEQEEGDVWSIEQWLVSKGNHFVNPELSGYVPTAKSPALSGGEILEDLFFEPTDYLGAFANADDKWEEGWTSFAQE